MIIQAKTIILAILMHVMLIIKVMINFILQMYNSLHFGSNDFPYVNYVANIVQFSPFLHLEVTGFWNAVTSYRIYIVYIVLVYTVLCEIWDTWKWQKYFSISRPSQIKTTVRGKKTVWFKEHLAHRTILFFFTTLKAFK